MAKSKPNSGFTLLSHTESAKLGGMVELWVFSAIKARCKWPKNKEVGVFVGSANNLGEFISQKFDGRKIHPRNIRRAIGNLADKKLIKATPKHGSGWRIELREVKSDTTEQLKERSNLTPERGQIRHLREVKSDTTPYIKNKKQDKKQDKKHSPSIPQGNVVKELTIENLTAENILIAWEIASSPFRGTRPKQLKSAQKLLDDYPPEDVLKVVVIAIAAKQSGWSGRFEFIPRSGDLIALARGSAFTRTLSNATAARQPKVRSI